MTIIIIITFIMWIPYEENPCCLQMTEAALSFHALSQIVPQVWLTQTSTRPKEGFELPTILTCPSVHNTTGFMHK